MNLDPEALRAIKRNLAKAIEEHSRLSGQLARLQAQMDAMKMLLADDSASDESKKKASLIPAPHLALGDSIPSIAGAIRDALRALGKPSSPTEVAQYMESKGFRWNGTGSLSKYVGPELFRMARRKLSVKRLGNGVYVYTGDNEDDPKWIGGEP